MRLAMRVSGLRVFHRPEVATSLAGQKTFEALGKAINEILDEGYQEAKRIITEQQDAVERVTQALLAQETLSREEFIALI